MGTEKRVIYSASMKIYQYPYVNSLVNIKYNSMTAFTLSGQRNTSSKTKNKFHEPLNYGARDSRAVCGVHSFLLIIRNHRFH